MTPRNRIPDHPQEPVRKRGFLAKPFGWALCTFLIVGGVLLWIEHRAHVLNATLLLLPLFLCLGMHIFMHKGHGGHGGDHHDR